MNELQHLREQVGMDGEQTSQANRKRQHPLTYGQLRDDMVHQMGRSLCHAPRAARGADAAALAEKDHQLCPGAASAAARPGIHKTIRGLSTIVTFLCGSLRLPTMLSHSR